VWVFRTIRAVRAAYLVVEPLLVHSALLVTGRARVRQIRETAHNLLVLSLQ